MKLIGRYHEFTINEIMLYGTDLESMEKIIARPGVDITAKEYRPKKKKREYRIWDSKTKEYRTEIETISPNPLLRHQVIAVQDLGYAKVSIYSLPMDAHDIECLGLAPNKVATKKEKIAEAVSKLTKQPKSFSKKRRSINLVAMPSAPIIQGSVWHARETP